MKAIYLIITALVFFTSCDSKKTELTPLQEAELDAKVNAEVEQMMKDIQEDIQEENSQWKYTSTYDKMSADSSFFATAQSKDLIYLDFPYDGGSSLSLTIRLSDNKLNAYIRISKGQFNSLYRTDYVNVKVDDQEARRYKVLKSNDNSSDLLFIENEKAFLKAIKGSSTLLIEPTFYSHGSHVFEFNMSNFKWQH